MSAGSKEKLASSRLQRAFIGALVIVPLAILVEMAYALRRLRDRDGRKWGLKQTVALGMSVVMVLSGLSVAASGGGTERPSGQLAGLALPSPGELTQTPVLAPQPPNPPSISVDEVIARAEALHAEIPKARYDLEAGAQAQGSGVDPTFLFVRDQIRYEAYPGVLRGPQITFATRAGNVFDRSLLLANLLKRKGVKTRFALGRLARPEVERLFALIFEPIPPAKADAVGRAPASHQPEAEAFQAQLRARAVRDYAAIRQAMGDAWPSKASPSREEVLREIEEHVWVQAEVDGRWVDLDPAFTDSIPGRTYTAAARTPEALPQESYQRVTIRVTSEALAGGSLKRETALEVTAPAVDLLDRQIFLTHAPGGGGGLAGAVTGGVLGRDAWTPALWVDGQFHIGKPIAFSEQSKSAERGQPPRGGLGGTFGAGGALAGSSQFVAEWLEFEIAFPDGRRDVTRRALVDRAGMAWRQAKKLEAATLRPLVRDTDGLTSPRAIHNIWFSAGGHNLADYADALRLFAEWAKAAAQPDDTAPQDPGSAQGSPSSLTFGEQVWPFAMVNFAFLVRSDLAIVPALNDSASIRFYADSPRIFVASIGPTGRADGVYTEGDLRRDRLRGLAREASAEAGIVERKIWFGVLQGALEHETAVQYALAGGGDPAAAISTSGLLTADGVIPLRPGASPSIPPTVDKEAAARILEALATRGLIVMLPRSVLNGGQAGWWEIAPAGADTQAILAGDLPTAGFKVPLGQRLPPPTGRPPGVVPRDPLPGGGARPPGPPPSPPTRITPPPPIGRPVKGPPRPVVKPGPMHPGGTKQKQGKGGGPEYPAVTGVASVAVEMAARVAPVLLAKEIWELGGIIGELLGTIFPPGL